MDQKSDSGSFLPLDAFRNIKPEAAHSSSTVIKAPSVANHGIYSVEASHEQGDEPKIIFHRIDGIIQSIEFVCTCGKRSEVRFDYDAE